MKFDAFREKWTTKTVCGCDILLHLPLQSEDNSPKPEFDAFFHKEPFAFDKKGVLTVRTVCGRF